MDTCHLRMDTKLMVLFALVGVLAFVDANPLTFHVKLNEPRTQRVHVKINDPGHIISEALAALNNIGTVSTKEVEEFAEEEGVNKNLAKEAEEVAEENGITSVNGHEAEEISEEVFEKVGEAVGEEIVDEVGEDVVDAVTGEDKKKDEHLIDNAEAALGNIGTVSVEEAEEYAEEQGLDKNLVEEAGAAAEANGITSIDGKEAENLVEEGVDAVGKGNAEEVAEEVEEVAEEA